MKRFAGVLFAVVLAVMLLVFTGPSFADVFGPRSTDMLNLGSGQPQKLSERIDSTSAPATLSIAPETILDIFSKGISYLGPREGGGYDFCQKEFVALSGATLYTKYNFSLDLFMINVDGAAAGIDYNLGAALPVEDAPLLKLFKYLYVGGSYGKRYLDDHWKDSGIVQAQFKLTY